jgi:YidC/Oxa1 family membrane protein insertase
MTTEKRLFLAIVLSFVVALVWSKFTPRPENQEKPAGSISQTDVVPAVTSGTLPDISTKAANITSVVLPATIEKTELVRLDNIEYEFGQSGAIVSATFPQFSNETIQVAQGVTVGDTSSFSKVSLDQNQGVYLFSDLEKQIRKTLRFRSDIFYIDLEVEIKNLLPQELTYNKPVLVGILDLSNKDGQAQYSDITIWANQNPQHFNGKKDVTVDNILYAGLRNRFFCVIVEPNGKNYSAVIRKLNDHQVALFVVKEFKVPGKSSITESFKAYVGPQDTKVIAKINPKWNGLVYYGTFDPISKVILGTLDFLHKYLRNWGLAIICISVLIYFILFPLSYKQMHSMKKMQLLQPKVEALKKEFKDNPQRLNKEILELYRENKVNPLGGCLPMLLQIPVFFALYQALIRSTSIKNADFLWIKDLASPDRLFTLPFNIPFIGNEFNLLPLLMAAGMYFQQKMSTSSSSGMSAEQQKMMQILFPIMFAFIFYKMPSGLVLYWFVNSVLMIVYQMKINRSLA